MEQRRKRFWGPVLLLGLFFLLGLLFVPECDDCYFDYWQYDSLKDFLLTRPNPEDMHAYGVPANGRYLGNLIGVIQGKLYFTPLGWLRGLFMGGVLAGVIGLVGVLNFINAVLTGILTRKRELAVLQSVGMTGKQLKTMLVCEGLYYTLLSLLVSLAMTVVLGPLVGTAVGEIFWFFTYRLTVIPILVILPIFLALGALVPLWTYRSVARHTIVERLREADA